MRQIAESEPTPLPVALPAPVRALVARMMNKRAEDRYSSYDLLIKAIREAKFLGGKRGCRDARHRGGG